MKTYDEILSAVLVRRDAYLTAKRKRVRLACGGVTAAVCCAAMAVSLWLWQSNRPDLPVSEEPTGGTTATTAASTTESKVTTGKVGTADTVVTTTRTEDTTSPIRPESSGTQTAVTSRYTEIDDPDSTQTVSSETSPSRYTEIDDPTEEQLPEWFAHVKAFEGEYDLLPDVSWPLGEPLEPQDLWLHHMVRDEKGRYVGEKIVTATFYTVEGFADKEILALKFKDYDTVLYYTRQESADTVKTAR